MRVLKVIEVLADSTTSWEDAALNAVKKASDTVNNIASVYIKEQSCVVENGKISRYRVNVKITFEVK